MLICHHQADSDIRRSLTSRAHKMTSDVVMRPQIIPVKRLCFISLLLLITSVLCEENRTSTNDSTPFDTSGDAQATTLSSFMASLATTSLETGGMAPLIAPSMPSKISGTRIPLNLPTTTELPGSAKEQAVENRDNTDRIMASTSTSMMSMTSERKETMPTEEMPSTKSRTVSNYRDVMDNMPTEPTEAIPPSLTTTQSKQRGPFRSKFMNDVRTMIKKLMSTMGAQMMRNLLQADISTDCTFGLLHFTRAIQDLEPWAMRLIDATGKYPTGLLQANFADLGAYDECVETVVRDEYGTTKVRGQYCDVHLWINDKEILGGNLLQAMIYYHKRVARFISSITSGSMPGLRIGVCVIDACDEQDLAKIGRTLVGPAFNITVKDCVTNEHGGINNVQVTIIAFLAALAAVIGGATIFEIFTKKWDHKRKNAISYKCVTAFSIVRNTRIILNVSNASKPETRPYKFAHGLRFLCIFWICLGHAYATLNENITRLINAVYIFESWESPILSAGFMAVDTYFFMSGYLLYYTLNMQKNKRAIVAVVALVRRFVRVTVPTFFMIMCIYLLPLIATGPNSKEFYNRFYTEVRQHWWHWIAQIRNWRGEDFDVATMSHLWYLSADFQLFVVALAVIQIFRTKKWLVFYVFAVLSVLGCGVSAWQIYGTDLMPFMTALHSSYRVTIDTVVKYYELPFYHAVCYFSGCMTFTLVEKYGNVKISKTTQALLWCLALSCGLGCLFLKLEWNLHGEEASETKRLLVAFIDRILWSVCIAWLWFTCSTNKGGFVNRFLSWNLFVPLARLSFGVYLIHVPFYHVMHRVSRERRFYSHFTLVSNCFVVLVWSYILSYILAISCEFPTANLEKLVFACAIRKDGAAMEKPQKQLQDVKKDTENIPATSISDCPSNGCSCVA